MNASMKTTLWSAALGLCLAAPAALAQNATSQDSTSNQPQSTGQNAMGQNSMGQNGMQPGMQSNMPMQRDRMHQRMGGNVMGRHTMPAVVDSVDPTTGIVLVTSEHLQLKLHFPPSSLTGLSAGDHITVHMGFSK